MEQKFTVIITTCPNAEEAEALTQALIESRLAACVQTSQINSTYHWQGKLETDQEIRLMIKTTADLFDEIAAMIHLHVSYNTPEVISLPVLQGSNAYLDWVSQEAKATAQSDKIETTQC